MGVVLLKTKISKNVFEMWRFLQRSRLRESSRCVQVRFPRKDRLRSLHSSRKRQARLSGHHRRGPEQWGLLQGKSRRDSWKSKGGSREVLGSFPEGGSNRHGFLKWLGGEDLLGLSLIAFYLTIFWTFSWEGPVLSSSPSIPHSSVCI